MKRLLLLTFVLLLPALPAAAQDGSTSSEVFVQQAAEHVPQPTSQRAAPVSRQEALDLLHDRLAGRGSNALEAYLGAGRNGNFALVTQEGQDNVALMNQEGARNLAVMAQQGAGNITRLSQQGAGNIYGSWLEGSGNLLELTQDGNDNVYLFAVQGNNHEHVVDQIGDNLQTIQLGATQQPASVQQIGSDMQVIIEHH